MKKLKSLLTLLAFCAVFSSISSIDDIKGNGDMTVFITYAMAEAGESNEFTAAVGATAVVEGALLGSTLGPVGAVAFGITWGL